MNLPLFCLRPAKSGDPWAQLAMVPRAMILQGPKNGSKRAPGHLVPEIEFYTETASQKMLLFGGLPFLGNLGVQPGDPNQGQTEPLKGSLAIRGPKLNSTLRQHY